MSDARTIERVRTYSADFESGEWVVRPMWPGARVGAGLYLLVPVPLQHAEAVTQAVQGILNGLPPSDPEPLI